MVCDYKVSFDWTSCWEPLPTMRPLKSNNLNNSNGTYLMYFYSISYYTRVSWSGSCFTVVHVVFGHCVYHLGSRRLNDSGCTDNLHYNDFMRLVLWSYSAKTRQIAVVHISLLLTGLSSVYLIMGKLKHFLVICDTRKLNLTYFLRVRITPYPQQWLQLKHIQRV